MAENVTITLSAQEFKALATVAAKKDIRYYLNGIYIDTKNNRIISTNGSRALLVALSHHVGRGTLADFVPVIFELPTAMPKPKDNVTLTLGDPVHVRVEYSSGLQFNAKTIDGRFPDIDRVIPKSSKAIPYAQFNPSLLSDVTKALKCTGVRLHFTGGSKEVMRVEFSGFKHITGMVMPVYDKIFD